MKFSAKLSVLTVLTASTVFTSVAASESKNECYERIYKASHFANGKNKGQTLDYLFFQFNSDKDYYEFDFRLRSDNPVERVTGSEWFSKSSKKQFGDITRYEFFDGPVSWGTFNIIVEKDKIIFNPRLAKARLAGLTEKQKADLQYSSFYQELCPLYTYMNDSMEFCFPFEQKYLDKFPADQKYTMDFFRNGEVAVKSISINFDGKKKVDQNYWVHKVDCAEAIERNKQISKQNPDA